MPFTYLITPPSDEQKGIIAFTIHANTITGFVGDYETKFAYCMNDYVYSNRNRSFGHRFDKDHSTLHTDETDFNFQHYHIRHKNKVTPNVLNDFLTQLQHCEKIKDYPGIKTNLTDKLITDIVSQYEQTLEKNNSLNFIFSNNPSYNSLPSSIPQPTVAEHAKCTFANITGCVRDNPETPLRITNGYKELDRYSFTQVTSLITGVAAGLVAIYGLFKCCTRKKNHASLEYDLPKKKL